MTSFSSITDTAAGKRWHDAAYWGLMLAACAVFYWMNVLTPLKEDDMLHSMVIGDLTPINSLGDLLHGYRNKFLITNGRTSDMVAELFCGLLGKPLFNVFNTLMFGLLAHLVSLLATGRRSLLAQGMLYACIGTCFPVPGETMLWLAGSCNYLWSITGALLVVYYLLHHRPGRLPWWKSLLVMLGAMLAGAGNEAISFGLFGGLCLYYACNRRLIDRTVVTVLAGYLLGVLLIMSSPAAWMRASSGGIVTDLGIKDLLLSRFYIVGSKMVHHLVPVAAIAVGIAALAWKGFKSLKHSPWPYIFLALAAMLLVFGLMPERPYAGFVTVSLIITILAADALLGRPWWLRTAAVLACLAVAGVTMGRGIKALEEYKRLDDSVVNEIKAAPAQAILREQAHPGNNRFLYPLPMKSDAFFPNEYTWRAYFGKENVQFVSDSVYVRYHEGRLMDGAIEMPFESDRPALTGQMLAFPDQDYMLLPLALDTLPTAYQVGTAYWNDASQALTQAEQDYRRRHALTGKSDPFGYYPLRYDGRVLMVLPLLDNNVSSALLLLDYAGDELLTLYRLSPNPTAVKTVPKSR